MSDKEVSITRYDPQYANIWNDFNRKAVNGLFMFDRAYMDYHSDRFKDHSLLFYYGDELFAIIPANDDGFGEFYSQASFHRYPSLFEETHKKEDDE